MPPPRFILHICEMDEQSYLKSAWRPHQRHFICLLSVSDIII